MWFTYCIKLNLTASNTIYVIDSVNVEFLSASAIETSIVLSLRKYDDFLYPRLVSLNICSRKVLIFDFNVISFI